MSYSIAVVGATGNVGRAMLSILATSSIPIKDVRAVASSRSVGKEVSFGEDTTLVVEDLSKFDFKNIDIAFFSPGAKISAEFAPKAAAAGCVVIDNTSHFRMDPDIPLVVPEVNPQDIKEFYHRNIIANPNCSTIQMVVALKPLHDVAKIKRVVVSTYQSVSGAGKAAMDELYQQTRGLYMNAPPQNEQLPRIIAFNVVPQVDRFLEDGSTKEEWKMVVETSKIMGEAIPLTATCVRVPVFIGHAEAINIEFETPLTVQEARNILRQAPGIMLIDNPDEETYTTPIDAKGEDKVFVSRIRRDPTVPNGLNLWVVADNLRKGAALNAIQIAELLIKSEWKAQMKSHAA